MLSYFNGTFRSKFVWNLQSYYGGFGRFSACALIRTAQHTDRRIDEIHPGDAILSWDDKNKRFIPAAVDKVLCQTAGFLWRVKLQDEESTLWGTPNSLLLTPDHGWRHLKDLTRRDYLFLIPSEANIDVACIESVEKIGLSGPLYNLITKGPQNYIVNGVIVHNYSCFPQFRSWWHRKIAPSGNKRKTKDRFCRPSFV